MQQSDGWNKYLHRQLTQWIPCLPGLRWKGFGRKQARQRARQTAPGAGRSACRSSWTRPGEGVVALQKFCPGCLHMLSTLHGISWSFKHRAEGLQEQLDKTKRELAAATAQIRA